MRYIRNFILNNFTSNKVPYSAQIELTLRCNGKCPFCSIHNLSKTYTQNEMSTAQIKCLIDQIAELGVNALSFTGGEPTLRHDLPELIFHMGVEHDFLNGIATNGYLMPKLFKENNIRGLDYMLLSLDYPTAEMHDRTRGIKGVFINVIKTIKLSNIYNIKPIISTVVMKNNLHLLRDMCELAENLSCSIELYPCDDIIRDFPNKRFQIENISEIIPEIPIWAKLIKSLRKEYKNVLTDPISVDVIEKGGFGSFGGKKYYQNILRCHVAEAYLFIRHDGFIDYPCKIHPIKSFNALKHPIATIYNSIEVREIMSKHDSYSFCSHCRLGCAIASSMPTRWKTVYAKYISAALNGQL
ncbi:MAG: radical SAM/SPASM domain-containing protein [Promethearchaeota archaeon]